MMFKNAVMKKIYMIPSISVVSLGAQAVCQINGVSGLQKDQMITVELVPRKTTSLLGITVSMRRMSQNLIPAASRSGIK